MPPSKGLGKVVSVFGSVLWSLTLGCAHTIAQWNTAEQWCLFKEHVSVETSQHGNSLKKIT